MERSQDFRGQERGRGRGQPGHGRRPRRPPVESSKPRRAPPPSLAERLSQLTYNIRGSGNTQLYRSHGIKESSSLSPIRSPGRRGQQHHQRGPRHHRGRQQRHESRLKKDSDGDVLLTDIDSRDTWSTTGSFLNPLHNRHPGARQALRQRRFQQPQPQLLPIIHETDEDGDAILTDLESEGDISHLGQVGYNTDSDGDVIFADEDDEDDEKELLVNKQPPVAQNQAGVNPFLAAVHERGETPDPLTAVAVKTKPRPVINPFAPDSNIQIHIPSPFFVRNQGPASLQSTPIDEPSNSEVEAETEREFAFKKGRRVINSWLSRLNYHCGPVLKKKLLFQEFKIALEASRIPTTRKHLGELLDLAFQTVILAKLRRASPSKSTDILSTAQELLHNLEAEIAPDISHSQDQHPRPIANSHTSSARPLSPYILTEVEHHQMANSTHLLQQMLGLLNDTIAHENGDLLQNQLPIEPPFHEDYINLLNEINATFSDADDLKEFIRNGITVASNDDKDAWYAFPDFLAQYFGFIRDVNVQDLLATYEMLSNLMTKCTSALTNDPFGVLILPTALEYSKVLARLAIGLDQQPHLIAHLGVSEDGPSMSLPEQAVMTLRSILGVCTRDSKPNGKGMAVYKIANLCLKILFQCNRLESASGIVNLVTQQPRALDSYPRSERVTYLYYLGRYYFSVTQFYSAMLALEAAYLECHIDCLKNRRLILVYLVTTNIILGRFPTPSLYQRREAAGFQPRFAPICKAIALGDLTSFKLHTHISADHADWFLYFGLLLPLRDRCEPLVWRSLARRTFLLYDAAPATDANGTPSPEKPMPTLTLEALAHVARALEIRALSPLARAEPPLARRHTNWIFMDTSAPPPEAAYVDPDFEGLDADEAPAETLLPDLEETECIVAGLVESGLMNGFVSRKQSKFAISGTKKKPVLQAGWPQVWETLSGPRKGDKVVGWKKEYGLVGGMEIRLSSAGAAGG